MVKPKNVYGCMHNYIYIYIYIYANKHLSSTVWYTCMHMTEPTPGIPYSKKYIESIR